MVLKTNKWQKALDVFLKNSYESLSEVNHEWSIIGSIATKLQGCDLIPNDVDILVKEPKTVHFLSNLMTDFYDDSKRESLLNETPDNLWLSTKEQPVVESKDEWGFDWVFARWIIHNTKVEVAHLTAPEGMKEKWESIWEAGPDIWTYIRKISYGEYSLPVVPLEIQLGTSFSRGFDDRIAKIIQVLKEKGYNDDLLKTALGEKRYKKTNELLVNKKKEG
ncbi:MAG TPA: hypothetical protein VMX55_11365 [candidate division Zixibacteria bacterium]|nr:hypothetical protein [candidate division Zixibacteria bacterium]